MPVGFERSKSYLGTEIDWFKLQIAQTTMIPRIFKELHSNFQEIFLKSYLKKCKKIDFVDSPNQEAPLKVCIKSRLYNICNI